MYKLYIVNSIFRNYKITKLCWSLMFSCVHLQNLEWYFVTKIVLTYFEKKLFIWSRKSFEIQS